MTKFSKNQKIINSSEIFFIRFMLVRLFFLMHPPPHTQKLHYFTTKALIKCHTFKIIIYNKYFGIHFQSKNSYVYFSDCVFKCINVFKALKF